MTRGAARWAAALLAGGVAALAARPGRAGQEELPPGPWFVDVAAARGLPPGSAHRTKLADLDGDGWTDAVIDLERVYLSVPSPGGGRRFERAPGDLGLCDGARRPDQLALADLDGDGDLDAYLAFNTDPSEPGYADPGLRPQLRLLEDGRYRAREAPALALEGKVSCAAFLDVDRDGWLELVTSGDYLAKGAPLEAWPLRLFAGGPGPSFREVTDALGLTQQRAYGQGDSRRPVWGITTSDWNNDGLPDLLLCSYGRQWNLLFASRPAGGFREVGRETGFAGDEDQSGVYPEWVGRPAEPPFRSNGNTFTAAAADYDNDGDVDVFLGEITHAWAGPSSDRSSLLTNLGPPDFRFRRDPEAMARVHTTPQWNQGDLHAAWLDFDNDGWQDLLLASGDYPDGQFLRLFRQGPPGRFSDVTEAAGFAWENCSQLSLGDYDRDGDVDVLIGTTTMRMEAARAREHVVRPALFENRIGQRNHWLTVRLEGAGPERGGANRSALVARVVVVTGGLRQQRELLGGNGHASRSDAYEAHFGLGAATRVDRLEVHWPDRAGSVSVFEGLEADQVLLVRQGAAAPTRWGPF